MCYLVSVSVVGFPEDLGQIFRQGGFATARNKNPTVLRAFGGTQPVFNVTVGGCSCGIYIAARAPFDEDAERARFTRKGWSAPKVERALEDRRQAYQRSQSLSRGWPSFVNIVARIVDAGGKVALLVHFYSGTFAEEPVRIQDSGKVHLADLKVSHKALREDVLVSVL